MCETKEVGRCIGRLKESSDAVVGPGCMKNNGLQRTIPQEEQHKSIIHSQYENGGQQPTASEKEERQEGKNPRAQDQMEV